MSQSADEQSLTGAARLRAYLDSRPIRARIISPGVPMPTVPLAAAAIGVDEAQIIKSVVFQDANGILVLGIASGTGRIDRGKLAIAAGSQKLRLAPPEVVLAATGYPAGGVSPIGHRTPVAVVIDRGVFELDSVYGGGGSEETLLEISPAMIKELTTALVTDISAS